MDAPWVVSYVFAGVLIACAVLVMFALTCSVINRRAHQRVDFQNEMRVWENDRRVEMADMVFEEAERVASRIDVTAGVLAWVRPAHCVPSVNPDGSIAVARELSAENKSAV